MLVRFKINETGKIVEKVFYSYEKFLTFKKRAEHSKKITLLSYWEID